MGLADELERLSKLRRDGALTQSEYDAAKSLALSNFGALAEQGGSRSTAGTADVEPSASNERVVDAPDADGSDAVSPEVVEAVGLTADAPTMAGEEQPMGMSSTAPRGTNPGSNRRRAAVLIAVAVVVIVAVAKLSSSGDGSSCQRWDEVQGQWYSVAPSLLRATAGFKRTVDENAGVWTNDFFGGMNGWVYGATTPSGSTAYWGVIGNTKHSSWYALNADAADIAQQAHASMETPDESTSSGLLSDDTRKAIGRCLKSS